jgi:hypothetical protein
MFGFDPARTALGFKGLPLVWRDYSALKRQNTAEEQRWKIRLSMPFPHDRYEESGTARGQYFYQDLLVARRIYERRPERHIDVGSRIDGFVAHVAVFRRIEVLDIRPLTTRDPNILFRRCDLLALPPDLHEACDSLSCLHALEHFGLGRYGDTVDLHGHIKGFENLCAMLKPGGILYLSLPIGPERIDFNAHRVFDIRTVAGWASERMVLTGFSYVNDAGDLNEDVPLSESALATNLGVNYGCGIFEFRKAG